MPLLSTATFLPTYLQAKLSIQISNAGYPPSSNGLLLTFVVMKATLTIIAVFFCLVASAQTTADSTEIVVKIKGITCANDLNIIHGQLKDLDGLWLSENYGPVGPSSEIKVVYNPAVIDPEAIYQVIEDSPACDFPDQRPYKVKK